MCGIIGYIGKENTKDIILKGLYSLEYRGYDSSGTSFCKNGVIRTYKELGTVTKLEKRLESIDFPQSAIAHTRWATHGTPSKKNAHPHTSGKWSLVHNGIIENASALKKSLHKHIFKSETDTEVIVALLDYVSQSERNPIKAIIKTCSLLKGSYALAIINSNTSNKIYVARNQSPLYISINENGAMVSSDLSLFNKRSEDYYQMQNKQFAIITENNVKFFDSNFSPIKSTLKKLKLNDISSELNGYNHYMIKEINDIPLALNKTYNFYNNLQKNIIPIAKILQTQEVHFFGCGTAYHAGLMGAKLIQNICHIPAYAHIASEFNDDYSTLNKNSLFIFISQSGETSDTLKAMYSIQDEYDTIAITNVLHSTIALTTDYVLPTYAGKEVSVASTKAFNTQLLTLLMLANHIASIKGLNPIDFNIDNLLNTVVPMLADKQTLSLSKIVANYNQVFFIGRSFDYITCTEGSLKLKEISYINCSAFPAGELKHGTLALVDKKTLIIAVVTNPKIQFKIESALNEVKARGAKTMVFTNLNIKSELIDYKYELPQLDTYTMQIISIIPLQLLSYYVSILKGVNPDKPKNLAKSVTVE